jgi:hypothetical protein
MGGGGDICIPLEPVNIGKKTARAADRPRYATIATAITTIVSITGWRSALIVATGAFLL